MLKLAGTGKVEVKRMIGVNCEKRAYRFGAVVVYPVRDFIRLLSADGFFWPAEKQPRRRKVMPS